MRHRAVQRLRHGKGQTGIEADRADSKSKVCRVVFYCADSPGVTDRAIRKLVPLGTPEGQGGCYVRRVVVQPRSKSSGEAGTSLDAHAGVAT